MMVSFYAQLQQLILFRRCLYFVPIMARTDKCTCHLIVSYLFTYYSVSDRCSFLTLLIVIISTLSPWHWSMFSNQSRGFLSLNLLPDVSFILLKGDCEKEGVSVREGKRVSERRRKGKRLISNMFLVKKLGLLLVWLTTWNSPVQIGSYLNNIFCFVEISVSFKVLFTFLKDTVKYIYIYVIIGFCTNVSAAKNSFYARICHRDRKLKCSG